MFDVMKSEEEERRSSSATAKTPCLAITEVCGRNQEGRHSLEKMNISKIDFIGNENRLSLTNYRRLNCI